MNSKELYAKFGVAMINATSNDERDKIKELLLNQLVSDINELSKVRRIKKPESFASCIKEINSRYNAFRNMLIINQTGIKLPENLFIESIDDKSHLIYEAVYRKKR